MFDWLAAKEVADHGLAQGHVAAKGLNQVVAVLEAAGLGAVPEDGDVLVAEGLHDEVGDHAAVLRMHVRTIRVEDAHHAHVHVVFPDVVRGKRLRDALALVVAAADADRVHIAPVAFDLRMHRGIAIDFGGRGMQQLGAMRLGEFEHVEDAHDARLCREDRPCLVVDRRGRAGEGVDLVELHVRNAVDLHPGAVGVDDVILDEGEVQASVQVGDVRLRSRIEIVEGIDAIALLQQASTKMRAQEPCPARDQCSFHLDFIPSSRPVGYAAEYPQCSEQCPLKLI